MEGFWYVRDASKWNDLGQVSVFGNSIGHDVRRKSNVKRISRGYDKATPRLQEFIATLDIFLLHNFQLIMIHRVS